MKNVQIPTGVTKDIETINTPINSPAISGIMALNQRSIDLNAAGLSRVSTGKPFRTRDEFHDRISLFCDKTVIRILFDVAQGLEDSLLKRLYLDPIDKILQHAPKTSVLILGAGPAGLCAAGYLKDKAMVVEKRVQKTFMTRKYIVWINEENARMEGLYLYPLRERPSEYPDGHIIRPENETPVKGVSGFMSLNNIQKQLLQKVTCPVITGVGIDVKRIIEMFPNIKHVINAKGGSHQQRGKGSYAATLSIHLRNPEDLEAVFLGHQRKGSSRFFFDGRNTAYFGFEITRAEYGLAKGSSCRFISESIVNVDKLHAVGGDIIEEGVHVIYATQRALSSERINGVPVYNVGDSRQRVSFFGGKGMNLALKQAREIIGYV